MPTMKSSLQFQDDKGEHGGRAALGASGGIRKQPGDVKKPEKEGGEDERKPPARQSGEGSGGEPEASNSLKEDAENLRISEKDLADFRATDLGTGRLLEARNLRKRPGRLPSHGSWDWKVAGGQEGTRLHSHGDVPPRER